MQAILKDRMRIWHEFMYSNLDELKVGDDEILTNVGRQYFEEIFLHYYKIFAFEPHEIDFVDLNVVTLMAIFTIPNVP